MAKPPLTQREPTAQTPLVDLQVYPAPKPKSGPKPSVDPTLYLPMYNKTPFLPPQYQLPGANPYYFVPNTQMPFIKQYNINVSGPVTDHGKIGTIFEDVMPTAQFSNTFNTLEERIDITHYIRHTFLNGKPDGSDIDLEGAGDNSLLSYLKFMELNPYNTNHFSNNPYKGLPDDTLIYRSCYPIRYDRYSNSVQCAKNSVGMNIRIYRMSIGEYRIKQSDNTNYYDYDLWREIEYYQYIRNNIIKQKVCPNFVSMHAYFISENCNIDFDKILQLKGKYRTDQNKDDQTRLGKSLYSIINKAHDYFDKKLDENSRNYKPLVLNGGNQNQNQNQNQVGQGFFMPNKRIENNDKYKAIGPDLNDQDYVGTALVSLTESPTYNFLAWASKTYELEGNRRINIHTGFHKTEVWYSILFQLMVALHVMQKEGIAFRNFYLEENVYIKDIEIHGNIRKYWKYIINGYEYYVPNYGYLLMIDSNYKDIENDDVSLGTSKKKKFKIYSNIYEKDNYRQEDISDLCFKGFQKAFSPNSFSNSFINKGGIKPKEEIIRLLEDIYKEAMTKKEKKVIYYINKYMRMFLNNRIGTYLNSAEKNLVRIDDPAEFEEGQIIVHRIQHDTFKFVLFKSSNGTVANILTQKEGSRTQAKSKINNIIKEQVPITSLFNYSKQENIMQLFKPNEANLNEDDLLETYIIN